MPTRDQFLLLDSVFLGIADSTQHRPFIGEEGSEPPNDQTFKIAGRDPPPLRMVLGRAND